MRETLNATLVPDFLCASTQLFIYSTQVSIGTVVAEGFDCAWPIHCCRTQIDLVSHLNHRHPPPLSPLPLHPQFRFGPVTAWNKLTARPHGARQRCPKPITISPVTFVGTSGPSVTNQIDAIFPFAVLKSEPSAAALRRRESRGGAKHPAPVSPLHTRVTCLSL